jgi:hypothetical protein
MFSLLPVSQIEVEIDVSTGAATEFPAAAATFQVEGGAEEGAAAWPSGPLDFQGVRLTGHEGEDATGSMKPKDLIIRALHHLPDDEQERIGFTALLEAHPEGAQEGVEDEELLEALQSLWASRQEALKEASEAMSESATTLKNLLDRLDAAAERAGSSGGGGSGSGDDEGGGGRGNGGDEEDDGAVHGYDDALEALLELEEHVGDMDNARDLHDSLGGWPSLTSLLTHTPRWRLVLPLSPNPNPPVVEAEAAAAVAKEVAEAARAIALAAASRPVTPASVRAAAALVVGTAVKNQGEFQSWVLESAVTDVNISAILEQHSAAEAAATATVAATTAVEATEAAAAAAAAAATAAGAAVGGSMKKLREAAVRRGGRRFEKAFANVPKYRYVNNVGVDGGVAAVAANDTVLSALVDMLRGGEVTGGENDSGDDNGVGSGDAGGSRGSADDNANGGGDAAAASAAASASKDDKAGNKNGEENTVVLLQRRALYAVGAALRSNQQVQRCFSELNGLEALKQALATPPSSSKAGSGCGGEKSGGGSGGNGFCSVPSSSSSVWSLKSKALAMVSDLLSEAHDDGGSDENSGGDAAMAVHPLADELRSVEWRKLVATVGLESCLLNLDHDNDDSDHDSGNKNDGGGGVAWSLFGDGDNAGAPRKVHEVALRAVAEQWRQKEVQEEEGGPRPTEFEEKKEQLSDLAVTVVLPRLERVRRRYASEKRRAIKAAAAAAEGGGEDEDNEVGWGYLDDLLKLADAAIAAVSAATRS